MGSARVLGLDSRRDSVEIHRRTGYLSGDIALFERLLSDLRYHRTGLPDLIHFPHDGGYRLIEVKGPGDRLQKNQQRWMAFFARQDIPHRVAQVSWAPP